MTKTRIRAAIFQSDADGAGLTPSKRLDKLAEAIQETELDLVLCPELFMSGYNVGDQLPELAETADGPFSQQVAQLAQANRTAIIYGYPERQGEQIYNSAIAISASGQILANHRKILVPPGFEATYFELGDGLTLFDLNGIRCAILICYDAEYPEAVRAAAEAGAQVVLVPTALVDAWDVVACQMMPTRAFENGVWLLYANHAGEENGFRYLGHSCIVAPNGRDAARAGKEETLLQAELDLSQVTAAQARLPYIREAASMRHRLLVL